MKRVCHLSGFSPGRQCVPTGHRLGRVFVTILLGGFGLAMVTLSASFSLGADPEVEALLLSPSACEAWLTRPPSQDNAHDRSNKSTLIREAERLALFLNPPQAKPVQLTHRALPSSMASTPQTSAPAIRPQLSTAKFTLHATSYYPSSPDESLALIDEPGKGLHWIRQGSQVGHLAIQEIRTGVIVLRDGKRIQEMLVEAVKAPSKKPGLKTPISGQYAKQIPALASPPIHDMDTRPVSIVRRHMVPLRSRPKRPR
jgi:hypothetical protein